MGCGECALSKYDHVMYDADMFGYNKNLALLNKSSENIRFLTWVISVVLSSRIRYSC